MISYHAASIIIAVAIALPAAAQRSAADPAPGFPNRPIRMIVPFAPQGPNDQLARMVGVKLTETWGQQVVVDNRPGAGTVIGTELAVRAPADGHTMLMISLSTAVNPVLKNKLPYDTAKELSPLVNLAVSPNILVMHPSIQANNVAGLLALAKAKPGEITYASGGTGAATHLAGELLASMGGVKMTHIPYKGANPATLDLLAAAWRGCSAPYARYGVAEAQIARGDASGRWAELMAFKVDRTRDMMREGAPLARAVGGRIGVELALVVEGGCRILDKIAAVRGNVFRHRPVLRAWDWPGLFVRALAA